MLHRLGELAGYDSLDLWEREADRAITAVRHSQVDAGSCNIAPTLKRQGVASKIILFAVTLVVAAGCTHHRSVTQGEGQFPFDGELMQNGRPLVGEVFASQSGRALTSAPAGSDGRFRLLLPGPGVFTITGRTTSGASCGPTTWRLPFPNNTTGRTQPSELTCGTS